MGRSNFRIEYGSTPRVKLQPEDAGIPVLQPSRVLRLEEKSTQAKNASHCNLPILFVLSRKLSSQSSAHKA